MKLVMTLLVRNEEDILVENIEFHRHMGVDHFIATDNLSTDQTPKILEKYKEMGILHLLHESEDDYSQHRWVTRMARMAATDFGADWVINNDADEFWWPDNGTSLKAALAAVPLEQAAITVPRSNFPVVGTDPEPGQIQPFYQRQVLRDTASVNSLGKPLPPKACHRGIPEIEVAQGNHSVSLDGNRLPPVPGPVSILHFPARSYAQFENKIRLGGQAYARNHVLPTGAGITWRTLHKELAAGNLRQAYNMDNPDRETAAKRLQAGRYVEDVRLRDCLSKLLGPATTSNPLQLT